MLAATVFFPLAADSNCPATARSATHSEPYG